MLLHAAPHIMWPLRFVMPHMPNLRPAWMIRAGLFLYDHLARRELLPGSRGIDMRRHPAGAPLVDSIKRGFVYSDGWVNDARLVVLNALDAHERGATIMTRTRLVSAVRAGGEWLATTCARQAATTIDVRARSIANAAGPWVGELLKGALGSDAHASQRAARQGQPYRHATPLRARPRVYLPESRTSGSSSRSRTKHDYTLIGTTDIEYRGDPSQGRDQRRRDRSICAIRSTAISSSTIAPADVAGPIPACGRCWRKKARTTRRRSRATTLLELDAPAGEAAAAVGIRRQDHDVPQARGRSRRQAGRSAAQPRPAWTAGVPLPGGDIRRMRISSAFSASSGSKHAVAARGSRASLCAGLRHACREGDRRGAVGGGTRRGFAPGLYEAELRYLRDTEWATRAKTCCGGARSSACMSEALRSTM